MAYPGGQCTVMHSRALEPWRLETAGASIGPFAGSDIDMSRLFRFSSAVRRDASVDVWLRERHGQLGAIARIWFEFMRNRGKDVRELLHDGHPTACVGDAAFAYVNAFRSHVNVGFFLGAELPDPNGMLEGTGKFMRHVKLKPGTELDANALQNLVNAAYFDMKQRATLT